jgi:hypothetical protein
MFGISPVNTARDKLPCGAQSPNFLFERILARVADPDKLLHYLNFRIFTPIPQSFVEVDAFSVAGANPEQAGRNVVSTLIVWMPDCIQEARS